MSRAIAFEGPDLTGKTSIIAALQKRMPYAMWPVLTIHSSKQALQEPGGTSVNAAGMAFYDAVSIMAKTMPVILDRCYVTNWVYGHVFHRVPSLAVIQGVARRLRPIIVYLYTPVDVLLERHKWRGDDFVNVEALVNIHAAYETWRLANLFSDEVVEVSTVIGSLDDIVDVIDRNLQERR